jgi:hypothetical protein
MSLVLKLVLTRLDVSMIYVEAVWRTPTDYTPLQSPDLGQDQSQGGEVNQATGGLAVYYLTLGSATSLKIREVLMRQQTTLTVECVITQISTQKLFMRLHVLRMITRWNLPIHKLPFNKKSNTNVGRVGLRKGVSGYSGKSSIQEARSSSVGIDYSFWHALWALPWILCFCMHFLFTCSLLACLSTRTL